MAPPLLIVLQLIFTLLVLSPDAQCATISDSSPKAIPSPTQSATVAFSSPPVAVDPCGPSVPDPRVVNSCGNSDDSFLSNTTSGGPEPYAVQCLSNGTISNGSFNQGICIALIPQICARMTADTPSAPYTQNKWIWFNGEGCSAGYWLPGLYQGTNSAGQPVTVKPARITDPGSCELEIFGSMFDVCFASDEYDLATVNLAELPSETGTGAPAPGGSAPGYPSYIIAPQQVGGCEDAMCYNTESLRVACNCF